MATNVKLKPGWLTRDISKASERATEWEAATRAKTVVVDRSSNAGSSGTSQDRKDSRSHSED